MGSTTGGTQPPLLPPLVLLRLCERCGPGWGMLAVADACLGLLHHHAHNLVDDVADADDLSWYDEFLVRL
uniref:Uncharacterized protein n=1 Tax=Aegilops tauschii TaxID=37682 RepID=M8B8W6_AEGTA